MRRQLGFTLIETLVALAIAAVALIALMGRLGASADVQRTLAMQAIAVDEAMNDIARLQLQAASRTGEQAGRRTVRGVPLRWRTWSEKTRLAGLLRQNVGVRVGHEPEFRLFIYREIH